MLPPLVKAHKEMGELPSISEKGRTHHRTDSEEVDPLTGAAR